MTVDEELEAQKIALAVAQRQRNEAHDMCIDLTVRLELATREIAVLKNGIQGVN